MKTVIRTPHHPQVWWGFFLILICCACLASSKTVPRQKTKPKRQIILKEGGLPDGPPPLSEPALVDFVDIPACSYQLVPVETCRQSNPAPPVCILQRKFVCSRVPQVQTVCTARPRLVDVGVGAGRRCSRLSDRECRSRCSRRTGSDRILTKCKTGVVCLDPNDPLTCTEEELCYEKPMLEKEEKEGAEAERSLAGSDCREVETEAEVCSEVEERVCQEEEQGGEPAGEERCVQSQETQLVCNERLRIPITSLNEAAQTAIFGNVLQQ